MSVAYYPVAIILITGMILSYLLKKLTLFGTLIGGMAGMLVFIGAGYTGLAMMAVFFVAGTVATSWQVNKKQQLKTTEGNKGPRNAGQVIANAGVAAILGAVTLIYPVYHSVLQLVIAASFSAAIADTLSSELGTVYGRRFFNILTFQSEKPGLDGVVSIEGTLIGVVGSLLIAAIYCIGTGDHAALGWLILCGTLGNLTDSVLGAALERCGYIKNNTVNFLNTLTAALFMLLIQWLTLK